MHDPMFHNWSTEQVYDYLVKEGKPTPSQGDLIYSENNEELEQEVTNMVMKAVHSTSSDSYGSIPQEITTALAKLVNPKLNWKEVLFNYMSDNVKDRISWKKPHKAYLPEFFIPTLDSKSLLNVTVAIDTSGSLFDQLSTEILPELEYLNQTFNFSKLTILDCDTEIHNIYELSQNDSIQDLKFTGNGGTNLFPVIEYCKEHETNLLIYFTDLDARQIEVEQEYPIIWICSSDHPPAPIGTTIYANK